MSTHVIRPFVHNSYWQIFEDWNADPDIANTARELYGDIDRLKGLQAERHQGDSFGKQESNTVDSTSALRIMDSYSMLMLGYTFHFYSMSICPTDS